MSPRTDGATRLLRLTARLLPGDWGRAMEAELAAIGPGTERWRFALGCTRAALTRPAAIAGLWRSLAGPVASGRAARIVRLGGLAVLAAEALVFAADAGTAPHGPDLGRLATLTLVWTALLGVYTLAVTRLTAARSGLGAGTVAAGAGVAVAVAVAWLAATALDPAVPTSSGPAVLAIGAAGLGAAVLSRGGQRRVAALGAAAGTALLIAVLIDGPLRLLSHWVANSAPPVYPPATADRLADSIGVWLLGALLAAALSAAIRSRRALAA